MATRWYLTDNANDVNPSMIGTWDNTSSTKYNMITTRGGDATFTTTSLTVSSGSTTTLRRTWISPGMAAGVVFNSSSTFTCVIRCSESTSAGDLYLRIVVGVVSEDGTTNRGWTMTGVDGTEFGTSLAAREVSMTGGVGSYTTVAGDRVVLEVGWSKGASGSVSGSIQIGSNDPSTDLSGSGDTGVDNPWFEISMTAGTGTGGGGAPPSVVEDYTIEGFITGVLDEWA